MFYPNSPGCYSRQESSDERAYGENGRTFQLESNAQNAGTPAQTSEIDREEAPSFACVAFCFESVRVCTDKFLG